MKIDYNLSDKDYTNSLKLHHKVTYKYLLLFTLFLILLSIAMHRILHAPFRWSDPFIILAGTSWVWFHRQVIYPWLGSRNLRKYISSRGPLQIELLDDAIGLKGERSNFDVLFEKLLKYKQNDDYILLYTMPRIFYVIPKALEKEGLDIPLLLEKLHTYEVKEA